MSVQIVAMGDVTTCSRTRNFMPVHESAEFNAWLSANAVSFVYADRARSPGEYAAWKQRLGAPGSFPAVFVLGLWFVFQFVSQLAEGPAGGGVAYMAHIGGFVAGMALVFLFAIGRQAPERQ